MIAESEWEGILQGCGHGLGPWNFQIFCFFRLRSECSKIREIERRREDRDGSKVKLRRRLCLRNPKSVRMENVKVQAQIYQFITVIET